MRYVVLSNFSLFMLALLISAMVSATNFINTLYLDMRLLPVVHVDAAGGCVKVDNYANGHAFNCQDVNVILRRYRTVTTE